MSKKLNEWLDEFVENGADPSDVTTWPENAGGSSEAGVNMIITEGGWYRLSVDELAKVIATMEQDNGGPFEKARYGFYVYGRGGSGVEFVYGTSINWSPVDFSIEDPSGGAWSFSGSAPSMSKALIVNKKDIESQRFELSGYHYYLGFVEGLGNNFYPIDMTKVFIPTEAPIVTPGLPQ